MDDDQPPLTSKVEAPSIKVEPSSQSLKVELAAAQLDNLEEGEIDERRLLVEYSSSPPPLIEDRSGSFEEETTMPQAKVHSLRSELELSTYEYAALEERYRTLSGQHRELRKLTSAYNDLVHGSPSYDHETASVEQLRADAGREGLRAKALEADVLRPMVCEAGGVQAFISRMQSVQSLIEQAGGLQELEELVSDAHMLRLGVDEVGGLQGLDHLVSQVNRLRSEQHEYTQLRASTDGPDGFRAKALKYDMLQQAFAAIQRGLAIDPSQAGVTNANTGTAQATKTATSADRSTPASEAIVTMNPARARLLSTAPRGLDPNRDLYEAPRRKRQPSKKTGSNDIPLGPPRTGRRSIDRGDTAAGAAHKRKHEEEPPENIAKRPRVDVGRALALVQATLSHSKVTNVSDDSTNDRVRPVLHGTSWQVRFNELLEKPSTAPTPAYSSVTVPSDSHPQSESRALEHLERASSVDSIYPEHPLMVKNEAIEMDLGDRPTSKSATNSTNTQGSADVKVGKFPIALWIGANTPTRNIATDLIKAGQIPLVLAKFLTYRMNKYIKESSDLLWNGMPPNNDTCILRYLIDGHRPSGQPQERRACRVCSSAWVRFHRPCALLQDIEGVRTVVFMPLRDALRRGVAWTEKRFWVMDAK